MTVTIRHWGGQIEDVDDDVAERIMAGYPGLVQVLARSPEVIECAMVEPPENAMLPRPRRRKLGGKKPKKPKGGKGY